MLTPALTTLEVTADIKKTVVPKVLEVLFRSLEKVPAKKSAPDGTPILTVSEIKERLQLEAPKLEQRIKSHFADLFCEHGAAALDIGRHLHELLEDCARFLRAEGAPALRDAVTRRDADACYDTLWPELFERSVLVYLQSSGMLENENDAECADVLVECAKQWTRRICSVLRGVDREGFEPAAYFLDVEGDLQGELVYNGNRVLVRGRPDAIMFDERAGEIHLWEYKFGKHAKLENQLAQVFLYMALIEAVKGVSCDKAVLGLFWVTEEAAPHISTGPCETEQRTAPEFPPEVEEAFEGYIGNELAVRRLKVKLTLALRNNPPRMPANVMFCGPGGLGKTELARRVARALGTPLIDVPAPALGGVDDLVSRIDAVLADEEATPEEIGREAGKPCFKYPPLVIFIDEVHALGKRKADAFLNFFEPNDRRCVTKDHVGLFTDAAILAATTDRGKLPTPFLSRFSLIELTPYTVEEVAEIVKIFGKSKGVVFPGPVAEGLAVVGRCSPRIAKERAKEFLEHHEFDRSAYPLTDPGLENIRENLWMVDKNGVGNNDLRYLRLLVDKPLGLSTISNLMHMGKEEVESLIEPYLLQIGAVKLTPQGRAITELGRSLIQD